jgi:hypothetical protein
MAEPPLPCPITSLSLRHTWRPRKSIIGKRRARPNKYIVLDFDTFPDQNLVLDGDAIANDRTALNKGVIANVAITPDPRALHDMGKCPNGSIFADLIGFDERLWMNFRHEDYPDY